METNTTTKLTAAQRKILIAAAAHVDGEAFGSCTPMTRLQEVGFLTNEWCETPRITAAGRAAIGR